MGELRQQRDEVLTNGLTRTRKCFAKINTQFQEAAEDGWPSSQPAVGRRGGRVGSDSRSDQVQEARMETINLPDRELVIRSPVDGVVTRDLPLARPAGRGG